jgi:hypothetical protein
MMRLFRAAAIAFLLTQTWVSSGSCGGTDAGLVYRVRYNLSQPSVVHITLNFSVATEAPVTLIMPRSFPGGYAQRPRMATKPTCAAKNLDRDGRSASVAIG